jgi:hypothetical protein
MATRRRKTDVPRGASTKLTPKILAKLLAEIPKGGTLREIGHATGVSVSTLGRWLVAGRDGDPRYVAITVLARKAQSDRLATKHRAILRKRLP